MDPNFKEDMDREGLVATDGAGGSTGTESADHRSVGAGAAVVTFDDEGRATKEALLVAKAPGNQTVPRAESWAACCVFKNWHGNKELTLITDASYVVKRFPEAQ